MASIKGLFGNALEVEAQNAARVVPRPIAGKAAGTSGHYRLAMRSGTIAAALAADAPLFSFRWGSTTHDAVILRVRAQMHANLAYTAAFNDQSIYMNVGRSFSGSHTGGTAAVMSGSNAKMRTDHATSQINSNGDIRMATTVALGGGTVTFDAQAFAISLLGKPNNVNAAAGTEFIESQKLITLEYEPDLGDGVYPLLLEQNEGFVIRNGPVWPAAGTGVLVAQVQWLELPVGEF